MNSFQVSRVLCHEDKFGDGPEHEEQQFADEVRHLHTIIEKTHNEKTQNVEKHELSVTRFEPQLKT